MTHWYAAICTHMSFLARLPTSSGGCAGRRVVLRPRQEENQRLLLDRSMGSSKQNLPKTSQSFLKKPGNGHSQPINRNHL